LFILSSSFKEYDLWTSPLNNFLYLPLPAPKYSSHHSEILSTSTFLSAHVRLVV
jgi:hypothetical protein